MATRTKQKKVVVPTSQTITTDAGKVDQLQKRVLNLNDRVVTLERELTRTQGRVQNDINNLLTIVQEMRNKP
jgi:hypothetical protein